MPVLAFDMTTANQESRRFEFRGKNNADYYEGDLELMSPLDVDLKLEKSIAGECAVYNLRSRSGLAFRRSWTHIRRDKTNVTVFWFVRRGTIAISNSGARSIIQPGACTITRSSTPFYMELTPDEASGSAEALHVVVPSHMLYPAIDDSFGCGSAFPTSKGNLLLADHLLTLLFEQDEEIDPETAEQLVQTLVNGVARTIAGVAGSPARTTIADKRVSDITHYINMNFSNADLNAKMVADACGISLRYLCLVLKKHNLSFSQLVWERRMTTAQDWLRDEKMQHYPISEIAYLVGFKSSAHFSRMFKARNSIGPREYRLVAAAQGKA